MKDSLDVAIYIIAIVAIAFIFIGLILISAHGQDFDNRYACFYADQYPFNEICHEQKMQELCDLFLDAKDPDLWVRAGCLDMEIR